uniref:Uncharacterized protein n=1 Tax=Globodera rostochiensis TaxID=31243 RepID=A0A914HEP7_GLORO
MPKRILCRMRLIRSDGFVQRRGSAIYSLDECLQQCHRKQDFETNKKMGNGIGDVHIFGVGEAGVYHIGDDPIVRQRPPEFEPVRIPPYSPRRLLLSLYRTPSRSRIRRGSKRLHGIPSGTFARPNATNFKFRCFLSVGVAFSGQKCAGKYEGSFSSTVLAIQVRRRNEQQRFALIPMIALTLIPLHLLTFIVAAVFIIVTQCCACCKRKKKTKGPAVTFATASGLTSLGKLDKNDSAQDEPAFASANDSNYSTLGQLDSKIFVEKKQRGKTTKTKGASAVVDKKSGTSKGTSAVDKKSGKSKGTSAVVEKKSQSTKGTSEIAEKKSRGTSKGTSKADNLKHDKKDQNVPAKGKKGRVVPAKKEDNKKDQNVPAKKITKFASVDDWDYKTLGHLDANIFVKNPPPAAPEGALPAINLANPKDTTFFDCSLGGRT